MHINFNIRKTPSLNKKNMHACLTNMHRNTLNTYAQNSAFINDPHTKAEA